MGTKLVIKFRRVLLGGHRCQQRQGRVFITIDAVKTIYEVFNVQVMTGMDIQSFFYMVKKAAEEMGHPIA